MIYWITLLYFETWSALKKAFANFPILLFLNITRTPQVTITGTVLPSTPAAVSIIRGRGVGRGGSVLEGCSRLYFNFQKQKNSFLMKEINFLDFGFPFRN